MYGPDVEAAASMPVMLPAGTNGWFGRNTPGNDDATPISIDFLNHVRGELKNIVEAFGYTEDKTLVNQIATALIEYVLTNGRFSDSLYAIDDGSGGHCFRVQNVLVMGAPTSFITGDFFEATAAVTAGTTTNHTSIGRNSGLTVVKSGSTVAQLDTDGNGVLQDLEVRGKIKNADGADVVFDDGITVEDDAKFGTKAKVVAATGSMRTQGDIRVGGTIESDTDEKVKLDGSNGNVNLIGSVNIVSNAESLTGKILKLDASGNVKHLGGHHCVSSNITGGSPLTVDWNSSSETHVLSAGITLADTPINDFGFTIVNKSGSLKSIAAGQSILVPVTIPSGLQVLGGWVSVREGTMSASMQASRWAVSPYFGSGIDDHIALTHVGATAATVNSGDLVSIVVHLNVIKIISAI